MPAGGCASNDSTSRRSVESCPHAREKRVALGGRPLAGLVKPPSPPQTPRRPPLADFPPPRANYSAGQVREDRGGPLLPVSGLTQHPIQEDDISVGLYDGSVDELAVR